MIDKCAAYARTAARQAKMKGLDTETVGGQFMVQAMMATFGIDMSRAVILAQRSIRFADGMLASGELEAAHLIALQKAQAGQ